MSIAEEKQSIVDLKFLFLLFPSRKLLFVFQRFI